MYALGLPEFRVVNTGLDLTRSFLQLTMQVTNSLIGATISGLDAIEGRLPDIPLVSRPGGGVPARMLPPGRMRALPPGGYVPSQLVQGQVGVTEI